jgi:hypothetical protein
LSRVQVEMEVTPVSNYCVVEKVAGKGFVA